jgi:hypothetical protein
LRVERYVEPFGETQELLAFCDGQEVAIMKRRIVPILVAGALMAVGAAPAFGDAGAPGTTFPEQPGTNIQAGCTAVTTNPGTNPTTGHSQLSPTAQAIVFPLVEDACLGG